MAPPVKTPPVQSGARSAWRFAVLVALLAAVAAAGTTYWLRENRLARVRASLPAPPETLPNATLRDRVTEADAASRKSGAPAAIAALARLYHANGYAAEATACWRVLVALQPKEGRWHYYLADLSRQGGDYAAAERELAATVTADATAAAAWLQLAEMKLKSGRHDAAEADYRRRLALLPDDPYAGLGLARLAQLRGQGTVARERLERILAQQANFSPAHNLYAELQAAAGREDLADLHRWLGRNAGRFREADNPWMDEVNAECYEARRLCHLGTIAYQTGRGDLGRAQFERAIAVAPRDPVGYQLLGELLRQTGSAEAARDILARGLAQAKDGPPAPAHYVQLSDACVTLGRPAEARQVLQDGLARNPGAAELHQAFASRLATEGHAEEAIASYRRAIDLNPALVEADFGLALTLLPLGRRAEAEAALHHALQQQPTYPKALLLLARLEIDAGRPEAAGQYLLPLLKANPGAAEVRQIVARWHWQAGQAAEKTDPAAAERHYRDGLAIQADHAGLNDSLGLLLLLAGRAAEAVSPLETARRVEPANSQHAFYLGQAYAAVGRLADARQALEAGLQQARQSGPPAAVRNFEDVLSQLPR